MKILKLDLNGQLVASSTSQPLGSGNLWASELELMNDKLSTICNDQNSKSPHLITFNPLNLSLISSVGLTTQFNHFLFGFVVDSTSFNYTAAGYQVNEEGDTNALLMKLDPGFSLIQKKKLGILGTEKFRDIGSVGDGFIATGVRDNKGLGGYDNYFSHLTFHLDTIMEQTDGSILNERNTGLIIQNDLNSAYLAGHNIKYGTTGSGNSYIVGMNTQNYVNSWTYSCEIPRIMLVDALLNGSKTALGPNLNSPNAYKDIVNDAVDWNMDIIFLYDFDALFENWPSISPQDSRVVAMHNLLDYAKSKGIIVGLIIGGSREKAIRVSDAIDGKTRWNYDHSEKINLAMLEHEFWNCDFSSDAPVITSYHYIEQGVKDFVFPGGRKYDHTLTTPNSATGTHVGNPYLTGGTVPEQEAFYRILVEDHIKMLQEIYNRKTHQANLWKSYDYISFVVRDNLTNTTSMYSEPVGSPGSQVKTNPEFRELYGYKVRPFINGMFLVFYRNGNPSDPNNHINPDGSINYGFAQNDDYDKRFEGIGHDPLNAHEPTLKIIPLFSAEETPNCGTEALGKWLGGTNRLNMAEYYYANQYRDDFLAYQTQNNRTEYQEFQHVATGWFKYTCLKSRVYSLASSDPFPTLHASFNCTIFDPTISVESEQVNTLTTYSLFPIPVTNRLNILIEDDDHNTNGVYKYQIIDSQGRIILEGAFASKKSYLNLSSITPGVYLFRLESSEKQIESRVFIKK